MNIVIKNDIEFGKKYRDKFTGCEGIAIGICSYATGCAQVALTRLKDDGSETVTNWFDETRIEGVEVSESDKKHGGPQATPPSRTSGLR